MNKFNMTFTQEQTEKAMEKCREFLCCECPYNVLDIDIGEYPIRCIHALLEDVCDLYFKGKE